MKAILRIFKYCRKRIIDLSMKNKELEYKNEVLKNEKMILTNLMNRMESDLDYYKQVEEENNITRH
jgi:hypothetical protein